MTDKPTFRQLAVLALTLALMGASLAGCATQASTPADKIGNLAVTPGKYEFYNCAQLIPVATGIGDT